MLKKIRSIENNYTVSKAAVIIGTLTLASRLVGLVRDRLFASHFGAGDTLDVYYAAFRIPDFIFNLLILGTLSVAFIPIFTEYFLKDKREAYRIANTVLNFTVLLMLATCLILLLLSGPLTKILVPGFNPEKFNQTLVLTRLFLLSPIIFTASNVFGSILNSQKRFLVANLAPILYNIGIIFGLLYLFPHFGLEGLALGVILGALLHLIVQFAEAKRLGFSWQPAFDLKNDAVRKIGKLFLPRIFGLDTSQISLLIGSIIGSLLASGTIAIINLANNLQAVPIGIFAISIAVAAFPQLAEQYAQKDHPAFIKSLGNNINQILFFIIPASIFILLFRAYIVRLVYGAGKFSWENTIATFNVLGIFAISLFAQALLPLLSRAFYARHNTKTPVIVGLFSLVLNLALSYWLATHSFFINLYFFGIVTSGVNGIALGFTVASILNCFVLFILLRLAIAKDLPQDGRALGQFDGIVAKTVVKIAVSSLIMGAVGYAAIYALAPLINTQTALGILIQSGLAAGLAGIAFLLSAYAFKLPQVKTLNYYFKRVLRLS